MVLTFESVDEILWCDHSNETSSAVLYHLFFNILQNGVWTFSWTLMFGTLWSERVKDDLPVNDELMMMHNRQQASDHVFASFFPRPKENKTGMKE